MPSDFTVVAIVAAYNEADIIEQCIVDLIAQGLQVYVIDDGSTDGTATLVEQFLGRGVLAVERRSRPASDGVDAFDWEGILARKAQLASELDADWFLHHDADEFREGPWFGLSLKASIQLVDASGYNAIDSACLNFRPVAERFERGVDVRQAFRYYEPAALHDRIQIRCWKRGERLVDLVSSGGHEAEFAGRKVFPIRFLLRHYPIRSQEHGERKVFVERRPRFRARERERGWHVQYDGVAEGQRFFRDPSSLIEYDSHTVKLSLQLRHRQVEELEHLLETCRSEADELHANIASSEHLLAETTAADERTRAELAAANTSLEAQRHAIAELRRRVEIQTREAESLSLAVESQRAECLAQRVERVALQDELANANRRIEDVYKSWSWRATAWGRAAYRALTGR